MAADKKAIVPRRAKTNLHAPLPAALAGA